MNRRELCHSTLAVTFLCGSRAVRAQPTQADQQLTRAFDDFYATALREVPEFATIFGVDTGDRAILKSRLHDGSLNGIQRRRRIVVDQLATLRSVDRASLDEQSRIDYDCVRYDREMIARAHERFAYGGFIYSGEGAGSPYVLSQIDGAYLTVPELLTTQHTIATGQDCEAYLSRLDAFATLLDQEADRVRHDAASGVAPPDFALAGALAQTNALAAPTDRSALVSSLVHRAEAAKVAGDWVKRTAAIHERRVLPALERQATLLRTLQPSASAKPGVWRLPDGDAYYAEALRTATTTDMTPDEVHRLGAELTAKLMAQAEMLFAQIGSTKGSVSERYAALFRDPRYLYPDTDQGRSDEIAALNRVMRDMEARLPRWFGTVPKAGLEIRRVPPASQGGESSHYTPGSIDGRRPGVYWLNMRDMGEVPMFTAVTTSFHEGIPGHHLQVSLQTGSSIPDVRKLLFPNAYLEGWAHYAEQLADEIGAFAGQPAWQLGYVHEALLRAGRLVVDTGIHARRWNRSKAVAELHGITGDPIASCEQEVERYACSPGQACGYTIGKAAILRLREKAKRALGRRFDVRRFHDAVLLGGSMPLSVLEGRVDAFIARQRQRHA
ncbi:DUF885 domain-containing protein [Sphingomonas lacusdianchii]|uniref:DUF885 domain-containing protein n=1 Tax=Sphingomonas lacusdianchii TaxID=2917992 RepID=UPI001F5868DA|nr:DUF885 family protein [Sphingomonas sp. JXJ CY 53]